MTLTQFERPSEGIPAWFGLFKLTHRPDTPAPKLFFITFIKIAFYLLEFKDIRVDGKRPTAKIEDLADREKASFPCEMPGIERV